VDRRRVPNIDSDTISIVDPATSSVRRTLDVADGPIAIVQAAGDVWVAHESGTVWRLSPGAAG
jgi:YVTN family beta-propeller protein